jgi:hypothetical protein
MGNYEHVPWQQVADALIKQIKVYRIISIRMLLIAIRGGYHNDRSICPSSPMRLSSKARTNELFRSTHDANQ